MDIATAMKGDVESQEYNASTGTMKVTMSDGKSYTFRREEVQKYNQQLKEQDEV